MKYNEWKDYKLGELIQSISIKHKFDKDKLIFLNTSDVLEGDILHSEYSEVAKMPGQAKKSIAKGDILFSEIRPKNKRFALVKTEADDYVVSTKLMVLRRVSDVVDMKFLYKYLTSETTLDYLQMLAEGRSGTFPQITFGELKNLVIQLPPIKEQISIANILSSLDEKIETNKLINKTLEEIVSAIFKQWFQDFEYPNENGEPYRSSGGDMVESELGIIPKGWVIKQFSTICSVKDGTHASPKNVKEGYPLITSKHLMETRLDFESAKHISHEDYEEVNRRSKVDRYDILISMIGTVGNLYLVQNETIDFAIKNVGLFKTSETLDMYEYLYCYLKTPLISQYIKDRMAGSTQQYISLGELRKIPVIVPNEEILNKFKVAVESLFFKIYNNAVEIDRISRIRDILLSKLMTGEIRVPVKE